MDAVEFLVNKARYCIFSGCNCDKCQIFNECASDLDSLTKKQAQRMVDVVEQWTKEHPIKTRQSEFLKIIPNATMDGDVIGLCPMGLEGTLCKPKNCAQCRRDYWLQEVE
nr:MAG TPA: DM DNA binding domain [Caudoviricetes sp.]DAH41378.1 MAG TPA: DM DNA binding domain [Caudoviricetes sp.]